jgi:hypothetical protein
MVVVPTAGKFDNLFWFFVCLSILVLYLRPLKVVYQDVYQG